MMGHFKSAQSLFEKLNPQMKERGGDRKVEENTERGTSVPTKH